MHIQTILKKSIESVLATQKLEATVQLEHPADLAHGDFACNVAMQLAKKIGKNPRDFAQELVNSLKEDEAIKQYIQDISVAGPGFINFTLAPYTFEKILSSIDNSFGKNELLKNQKAIVEYTDPNPFKQLHIGHLMSNTIGESLSRIIEWSGAETMRACYQGDVGMHVAKSIWGLIDMGLEHVPKEKSLSEQVHYLGQAYAKGATAYAGDDEQVQADIKALNKKIYDQSDADLNELYQWGKQVSLDYFETEYKKLGTFHNQQNNKAFNFYFFESEAGPIGKALVEEYLQKGIFEQGDGAIVFKGENYGLHTRVFINSEGLPTYEAKELGLLKTKYEAYPYDLSVIVTGNEVNQYFQVLFKAMSLIDPILAKKNHHIGHGMLRLPSGKMSSRTGSVIAAEDLVNDATEQAKQRQSEMNETVAHQVAIAAIKFAILKQHSNSDIVFDMEQSLSFEGDSGPYLQYTHARSHSILRKANEAGLIPTIEQPKDWQPIVIERIMYRFPEMVVKSLQDYSPHYIATFLIELAHEFNSWYGETKIVDPNDITSGYKLALTASVAQIIQNGLWLLGIEAPEKM